MSPVHYVHVCEKHGRIVAQCRCPSRDKAVTRVPCPGKTVCATRPRYDSPYRVVPTTGEAP